MIAFIRTEKGAGHCCSRGRKEPNLLGVFAGREDDVLQVLSRKKKGRGILGRRRRDERPVCSRDEEFSLRGDLRKKSLEKNCEARVRKALILVEVHARRGKEAHWRFANRRGESKQAMEKGPAQGEKERVTSLGNSWEGEEGRTAYR